MGSWDDGKTSWRCHHSQALGVVISSICLSTTHGTGLCEGLGGRRSPRPRVGQFMPGRDGIGTLAGPQYNHLT